MESKSAKPAARTKVRIALKRDVLVALLLVEEEEVLLVLLVLLLVVFEYGSGMASRGLAEPGLDEGGGCWCGWKEGGGGQLGSDGVCRSENSGGLGMEGCMSLSRRTSSMGLEKAFFFWWWLWCWCWCWCWCWWVW